MFKYFLLSLARPRKTIERIIKADIKMQKIIFFLFWLGLVRGVLEVIWIFAIRHRLTNLIPLSRQLSWYLFESGPFVLANVLTAYLRWAMYSITFYLALRFLKIKVDFSLVLKAVSVILGLYVLTGLVNYLHLFFNITMVKFQISQIYSYSMGIGQLVSGCFLLLFIYNLSLNLKLDRLSSILTSLLVFSIERIFYFFSAWVYFRLPMLNHLAYKKIFYLGNHLSSLASILLTLLFLWLGYKINARKTADI